MFLTSALDGGEWLASRPGRFTTRDRAPGTHWIGGWVDLRASLDDLEKRKFLTLPGDSNSDPSVDQLVASRYPGSLIRMIYGPYSDAIHLKTSLALFPRNNMAEVPKRLYVALILKYIINFALYKLKPCIITQPGHFMLPSFMKS
jgi:hypothetical protein